jgi:hypothetical protein
MISEIWSGRIPNSERMPIGSILREVISSRRSFPRLQGLHNRMSNLGLVSDQVRLGNLICTTESEAALRRNECIRRAKSGQHYHFGCCVTEITYHPERCVTSGPTKNLVSIAKQSQIFLSAKRLDTAHGPEAIGNLRISPLQLNTLLRVERSKDLLPRRRPTNRSA